MKKITTLSLLFALLMTSLTVYAEVPIDSVTVDIQPIKYEEVLEAAKNNSLEELLYPSGLTLPTKYCDIFAFASNMQEKAVTAVQIKRMLELNWPTQNKRYTMAELLAAELYYYTFCWPMYTDDDMSPVVMAIDELSGTQLSFRGHTYSAVVPDTTKFVPVLEEFEDLLTSAAQDEGNPLNHNLYTLATSEGNSVGVPLTYGYNFNWTHYMQPVQTTDDVYLMRQQLANYYEGLRVLWATFGIQFKTSQVNVVDTAHLLAYNQMTSVVLDDELLLQSSLPLFSGDLEAPPDASIDKYFTDSVSVDMPVKIDPAEYRDPGVQYNPVVPSTTVSEPSSSSSSSQAEQPPIIESPPASGSSTMSDYQPNPFVGNTSAVIKETDVPVKTYNLRDMFTIVSIFVVLVLVTGLCIVDFIRKRDNPANRWKRR